MLSCAMRRSRQRQLLLLTAAAFGIAAYARLNLFAHTVTVINVRPVTTPESDLGHGKSFPLVLHSLPWRML